MGQVSENKIIRQPPYPAERWLMDNKKVSYVQVIDLPTKNVFEFEAKLEGSGDLQFSQKFSRIIKAKVDDSGIKKDMFLSIVNLAKDFFIDNGRIFVCPTSEESRFTPFEILGDVDGNRSQLLRRHENIEIHLLDDVSAIITGYLEE